jgi:hypothetical protein
MTDILERLDNELDMTAHDQYICRPLPRSVVAAAAAEIRKLRMLLAFQRDLLEAVTAPDDDVTDIQQG